ncbi:MAG: hypothetical protein ACON5F_03470 [Jejuia sp.]
MNTIKWFKEYEKKGVGDIYEGAFEVMNYKDATLTLHLPEKPIILKNSSLQLRRHREGHSGNIYSTYAISNLLLRRKAIHRVDKRMSQFGSHCLIIKDVNRFINSIRDKLTEIGIESSHGIVRYKNLKINNHNLSLFHKTHMLSYQKEHRIIAWTKDNHPLKFEIGSLEEYSELHSTHSIIENLTVDYKPRHEEKYFSCGEYLL